MSDQTDSDHGARSNASQDDEFPGARSDVNDVPVVTCSRCNREWALAYELDELHAGNQAVEQFAIDHARHTGHFPDDVTPWIAACRRCPAGEEFLSERPARRWARTHARHAGHSVEIEHGDEAEDTVPESAERE